MIRRSDTEFVFFRPAVLALLASSGATWLALLVWGTPWNKAWWALILLFPLASFLAPLLLGIPRRRAQALSIVLLLVFLCVTLAASLLLYTRHSVEPRPEFTLHTRFPTRDKSQSKLWYAHGGWWAWLPDGAASTLWRRDSSGSWGRVTRVGSGFDAMRGSADVWPEDDFVTGVVFSPDRISFASLRYVPESSSYEMSGSPQVWEFQHDPTVNNATIARDSNGIWWISYTQGNAAWIVASLDARGESWHPARPLARNIGGADKSVVFPLADGIGVMWGVQRESNTDESINFVMHRTGAAYGDWSQPEVLRAGVEVGEDHFNAALASNGDVYVSTMDDSNRLGEPLLIMWIRNANGSWESVPYGKLRKASKPTRALVLLRPDSMQYSVVHTRLNFGSGRFHDVVYRCGDQATRVLPDEQHSLLARPGFDITDPTSTKQSLPGVTDWIVLASDAEGRVYEGVLTSCAAKPTLD